MRIPQSLHRIALSALLVVAGSATLRAQGASSAPVNPATHDARVGLTAGKYDAATAISGLKLLSVTKPSAKFADGINSDLAFFGPYAIQGNFNGYQVWNLSNPANPTLRAAYYCPASQSDVSVYKNLLIVSAEATSARLDCGAEGVRDTVSSERIRGIRVFDISDLDHPRYVTNVQTCRGSHTHSVLVDPRDTANVYVYISGSAPLRSPSELAGCVSDSPATDPNSALMRIEIIKIPVAHPEQAAVVSTARIFNDLKAPPTHGEAPADSIAEAKAIAEARAHNGYVVTIFGNEQVLGGRFIGAQLDSIVKARGGTGAPTAADSAALHAGIQGIVDKLVGTAPGASDPMLHSQCHDITPYPWLGLAGGACEGHGLLLDISNPTAPVRLDAVDDQNFSYWHSATFNNDGTKVLFSDEWGGGGAPKCRATDPRDWGADAIFSITSDRKLKFESYYKLPAPQTPEENCVAHNGSLIPVPGRDVMVQAWYQGGISVFDWTDPQHVQEIAYFDRGPLDSTRMVLGGPWSSYWYNGVIVSSEITRGLDVLALEPSQYLSQNEIDAAKTAHLDYLNVQDQPHYTWPASFSLAGAYVDQLERSDGLSAAQVSAARGALARAQGARDASRRTGLTSLASQLEGQASSSSDGAKVRLLADAVRALAR